MLVTHRRRDVIIDRIHRWAELMHQASLNCSEVTPFMDSLAHVLITVDLPDTLERLGAAIRVIEMANQLHATGHPADCGCAYSILLKEYESTGKRHARNAADSIERRKALYDALMIKKIALEITDGEMERQMREIDSVSDLLPIAD